jgi:glutathione synthase/RimK-type ligase-like ATP-grasp enzyme
MRLQKRRKHPRNKNKQEKMSLSQEEVYDVILKSDMSSLLPETTKLSGEKDLWSLLDKYSHVILKPTSRSQDAEIIKVLRNANDQYEIHHRNEILTFKNGKKMIAFIEDKMKLTPYWVQQYIQFATIEKQPFDLKVVVRRRKNEHIWEVTGRYVEVGSEVLPVNEAIDRSNLKRVNTDELLRDIDNAALRITQKLHEVSPHHRLWGLDLRIDSDGKLWIIETHSKPAKVKGHKQRIYAILKRDKSLSPLLPKTTKLNEQEDLWPFLDKYRHVILKPTSGSLGMGIIKVLKNANDQYEFRHRNQTLTLTDKEQVNALLTDKKRPKPYIIQQYIQLAEVANRPFDLRVMVQRKKGELVWKVTGVYAKVAHEGYFTTNLAKKGKVVTVNSAIDRSNLKEVNTNELLREIDNAALRVAQRLREVSPNHRIWGLDMGIDSDGKLWIIEANSKPGMKGFKRLKDLSMYRTIQAYKKMK